MIIKNQFKPITYWVIDLGLPGISILISVISLYILGGFVHSSEDLTKTMIIFIIILLLAILGLFLGYSSAKQKRIGVSMILSIFLIVSGIGYMGFLWSDRITEGAKFIVSIDAPGGGSVNIVIDNGTDNESMIQVSVSRVFNGNNNVEWRTVRLNPGTHVLFVQAFVEFPRLNYPSRFEVYPGKITTIDIAVVGYS